MPNDTYSEIFEEFNLTGRNLAQLGSYQIGRSTGYIGWYFHEFQYSRLIQTQLWCFPAVRMPGSDVESGDEHRP